MKSFFILIIVLMGAMPGLPYHASAQQLGCRTFSETSKTVCGTFLTYWNSHGGLAQQGYPISGEFQEVSDINGKQYAVQYFERAVFEKHPENAAPYDVLLSLLGTLAYKQKYPDGTPNALHRENALYFPQTGHYLGGIFRQYWDAHGGLAQQGYPISDEFTEVSALNGKEHTVQYFERAVFEAHPENTSPYNVLLSQLGTFRYSQKYPKGQPTMDTWETLRQRPLKLPTIAPGQPCPADKAGQVTPEYGLALGSGPAYPVGFNSDGTYSYAGAQEEGGWFYLKVLWIVSPSYKGPILVRGRQLDGPNELRFESGPNPAAELRLDPTDHPSNPSGWYDRPTYTRLRSPGCYAYQIDGTGFSEVITFQATNR